MYLIPPLLLVNHLYICITRHFHFCTVYKGISYISFYRLTVEIYSVKGKHFYLGLHRYQFLYRRV